MVHHDHCHRGSAIPIPSPSSHFDKWLLQPDVVHLDHGFAGGCPREVFEAQHEIRYQVEADPSDFFTHHYHRHLIRAKQSLSQFINARNEELVLVPGTTHGLNVILQSLNFRPGDEILVTNHSYASATSLVQYVADRDRAKVVMADVPFPLSSSADVIQSILAAVTHRTRFALIDHIPSRTAVIFPIKEIISELAAHGIDTLVDGAHAPGQVSLNITELNAAYYVGSCHKWMCGPRGVGFMHIRSDRLDRMKPLIIPGTTSSRDVGQGSQAPLDYQLGWVGTFDPSAYLIIPGAVRFLESLLSGGSAVLMKKNHDLAVQARQLVFDELHIPRALQCPDRMVGAMVSIPLPDLPVPTNPTTIPLQILLRERYHIDVPVYYWPSYPERILRFSCQAHNSIEQYKYLATSLKVLLEEERIEQTRRSSLGSNC